MLSASRRRKMIAVIAVVFALFVVLAQLSEAQSGRKPPKRPQTPDPIPPKQEEPPIQPSSQQDNSKPKTPVKVAWYLPNITGTTMYSRIVQEGCLEELSRSGSVAATAGGEVNRKQASDLAKNSLDLYVLWFELDVDYADMNRAGGQVSPQYLYVRYEIFTPGTGKTKTSGNVYQRQTRGPGGVGIPVPQSGWSYEYSLKYAGAETADRLLDALNFPRPSDRR